MIEKHLSNLFLSVILVLAGVSLVGSVFGQTEGDSAEVSQLRSRFEKEVEALSAQVDSLNEKYRGYLEKQKSIYQQAGKLEAMLAVDEELKTFEESPAKELSSFPEINRLQGIYREQHQLFSKQQLASELKLIQQYREKASDLASTLTKAGRIAEARLALAESKRFAEMEKDPSLAQEASPVSMTGESDAGIAGKKAGEEMENFLEMKLHWIPAGEFFMGLREGESENQGANVNVKLSRGFWIGKHEVTQEEFEKIMGKNPSKNLNAGEQAPVESVKWSEALAFCEKLTDLAHENGTLPRDWAYTLPTEAQWEYACRAGSKEPYSGGDLDELGWYSENTGNGTHETGEKKANPWGLHDMHGNVREWCLDSWSLELKGGEDPIAEKEADLKVYRGGSWKDDASQCRSGYRSRGMGENPNGFQGFRVALILNQ